MGEGVGYTPLDDELTPIVPQLRVRVVVECATVEAFVEEYHRFVQGDRIFIATEVLESRGNVVQFRIDLADGTALVHGSGTVLEARSRPHDGLPRGMLLRFVALDERSAKLIDRMTARQALADAARVVEIEAPPAGADELTPRWHTASARREAVLPANPFGDVPEAALAYFVDWAIERSGSTSWAAPGAVAFCAVRMRAPRRRRRTMPRWAAFAAGVVLGGAAILAGNDAARALLTLTRARVQPVALAGRPTLAPPTTTTPGREPPQPARDVVFSAPAATADTPRKTAELVIAAEPGARVLLDGARVGHTPLLLHVAPGAHTVTLSRPRYATRDVAVQAPGRVAARLERPRATLHVSADAPGAVLFVDGESIGPTPISADVAGYERADVEVRAPGCRAWHARVYVKPPLTDLHAPPCASER